MPDETGSISAQEKKSANPLALLTSLAVGAALMYFLDPDRGTRRRKLVGDKLVRLGNVSADRAGSTVRDLRNRAYGVRARIENSRESDDADDTVLEQRVRAELGRVVSHPHAINVTSNAGRVSLKGDILAQEVDSLIDVTRSVGGVREVDNQLAVHPNTEGIPSLQGGGGGGGARQSRDNQFGAAEAWS